MKIAIIGHGKMGRTIEKTAETRGHTIGLIIDEENKNDLTPENLRDIDVAIEFSSPESAADNIIACLEAKKAVVSGTTGWLNRWDEITGICEENNAGLFYASNYSIGVNILFSMNEKLAAIMDRFNEYKPSIKEVHHIHKLDAPSGTAISLAEGIIENHSGVNDWKLKEQEEEFPEDILPVNAEREGEVFGYHQVTYESGVDTISLSHNAMSRQGFATGAVLAAEFLHGRKGIYGMKDMLKL